MGQEAYISVTVKPAEVVGFVERLVVVASPLVTEVYEMLVPFVGGATVLTIVVVATELVELRIAAVLTNSDNRPPLGGPCRLARFLPPQNSFESPGHGILHEPSPGTTTISGDSE